VKTAETPEAMIRETVVTTVSPAGGVHITPLGVTPCALDDGRAGLLLQPFKPSTTLENVLATGCAVVNYTTDVRVIAGCLTGRRDWPTLPADRVKGERLVNALAHAELTLARHEDEALRPRLFMAVAHEANHAPFHGFNRAQGAVVEAAILVSRLHLLPAEKVDRELEYLRIAIEKTAGPDEREAWGWLMERVAAFRAEA